MVQNRSQRSRQETSQLFMGRNAHNAGNVLDVHGLQPFTVQKTPWIQNLLTGQNWVLPVSVNRWAEIKNSSCVLQTGGTSKVMLCLQLKASSLKKGCSPFPQQILMSSWSVEPLLGSRRRSSERKRSFRHF